LSSFTFPCEARSALYTFYTAILPLPHYTIYTFYTAILPLPHYTIYTFYTAIPPQFTF